MATVLENRQITRDIYRLRVAGNYQGDMGQFYMLRSWRFYPLLSRPLSIHDVEEGAISFLYRVQGEGTQLLKKLIPGEELHLEGPLGNGYPKVAGKIALVGGGIGIAPLYYAAKELRARANTEVHLYMGFKEAPMLEEEYGSQVDQLFIKLGGNVTELVEPMEYDYLFTCGPESMMRSLTQKARGLAGRVYVSVEKHMACGIGACLVCTCKTKSGNRKACSDGPVFLGEEVYHE